MSTWLWLSAVVFGIAETIWFGGNWSPQTTPEVFCDGVTIGLGVAAALLTIVGR